MLQMQVSSVSDVSEACCKYFIRMLPVFQKYVASVYSKCFICSDVCYKCFICMLLWLSIYVTSIYSKCFIYFQTYVVRVLSRCCICCSGYTHMLQMFHLFMTYVAEVLHFATLVGIGSGRMLRRSLLAHRSEAGVVVPHLYTQQQEQGRAGVAVAAVCGVGRADTAGGQA
jgi:hypothetical protein